MKDKVFHALVNPRIPLSDRQEIFLSDNVPPTDLLGLPLNISSIIGKCSPLLIAFVYLLFSPNSLLVRINV